MDKTTANKALQRSAVTLAASSHRLSPTAQPARQLRESLSLGSLCCCLEPRGGIAKTIGVVLCLLFLSACDSRPRYDSEAVSRFFDNPPRGNLLERMKTVEVFDLGAPSLRLVNRFPSEWRKRSRKVTVFSGVEAAAFLSELRSCFLTHSKFKPVGMFEQVSSGAIVISDTTAPFGLIRFDVYIEKATNSRYYWVSPYNASGAGASIRSPKLEDLLAPVIGNDLTATSSNEVFVK